MMVSKRKYLIKIFFILLGMVIVFAHFPLFNSIKNLEHYRRVYKNPITVSATVTRHGTNSDDGGKEYISYIEYRVNGINYKNIEYEKKDSKYELTDIGENVILEVSTEDPGKLLINLKSSSYSVIISLALFFTIVILPVLKTIRRIYCSDEICNSVNRDIINKDLKLAVFTRPFAPITCLMTISTEFLVYRYHMVYSDILHILALAFMIAFAICLFVIYRNYRYIINDEYIIKHDILIRKKDRGDIEKNIYKLYFQSDYKIWSKSVVISEYNSINVNDEVLSVYFPRKRKPVIFYSNNGVIF